MHNALENGEFSLHYQPKLDFKTGRITSMEGLLRWNNPKIGAVSPVDFIPVAEHTGLISEIGRWVIKTGCAQARKWAEAGYADVGVALNLSPLQFREKDLFEQIAKSLEATAVPPSMLEIEVTESVVMENFNEAIDTIKRLAAAGVHIAIDDFGTGYSSLAYLKHLPVNTLSRCSHRDRRLRNGLLLACILETPAGEYAQATVVLGQARRPVIDRSFLSDTVPDEQDKLIITAIIAMAHSMQLSVVAEGVETEAQRAFLKELECDEMQGYLFCKPIPADDTLEILQRHNDRSAEVLRTAKIA